MTRIVPICAARSDVPPRAVPSRIGALALACIAWLCLLSPVGAQVHPPVLNITNDPGGNLVERLRQIEGLRRDGTRIAITGGYCHSACTLYLGLANTCITPDVQFGFHGPQLATRGLSILPHQFEHWSHLMADHYPVKIRSWFLSSARHSTDLLMVSGQQLIHLGVPACGADQAT